MAQDPITYEEAKQSLADENYPTSDGDGWNNIDAGSYQKFAMSTTYAAGEAFNAYRANYGFAYPGEMPQSIVEKVTADSYSATVAGTPTSGDIPLSVTFTVTETGGTATSFLWDFGDSSTPETTTVPNAAHIYTVAGTFTAKVTPSIGEEATPQISAAPITATEAGEYSATLAGTPTSGDAPLEVTFTVTETGGTGTSFAWDFGDGNTDTTSTPNTTHEYVTAGTFTAKVTPTVDGSPTPQVSAPSITVTEAGYVATLDGAPTSGTAPLEVTFTVTETGGTGTSFAWDFGDGDTDTTSTPNTTHEYSTAGTFTAKVTPTVDGSPTPQVSAPQVTVTEGYSITLVGAPASGTAPVEVTFTGTEVGGTGTSFAWDFGDSNTDTTATPTTTHEYTTAGTFTPTVTATVGGIAQTPVNGNDIIVTEYGMTLVAAPASGTTPLEVTLTGTETGGTGTSFAWDFGDGNSDTTSTPVTTHEYATAGTFTPKVTPTVGGTARPQVTGNDVTTTDYSMTLVAAPDTGASPLEVTLTGTEVGGTGTSFLWDFGDSGSDTTSTPVTTHQYAAAGTYTPKVTPTVGGTARPQVTGNDVTVS